MAGMVHLSKLINYFLFQEELSRVYVQMGILRDKTVCKKNPHISKRKGGKKLPHRRFSLQVN